MPRLAWVALVAILSGCTTSSSGCSVVAPGQASANFLYHAAGTEAEMRALLEHANWTEFHQSGDAQGIFLSASQNASNQALSISASMSQYHSWRGDEPITGFGIHAPSANVSSDDAARVLLSPYVSALQAGAPSSWGAADSLTYSGGAKLCRD